MRSTLAIILVVLACCTGCMTQTTERGGKGTTETRKVWIWQKEFWSHK